MLKTIAIHLPQFHPIPENDAWWGKGFTEWTNVAKAKPLYEGHYQPHVPADLGFYDLRLEASRLAQADLARQYGINGFCYYHYWFNGKRLLNKPLDEIIASRKPDFPFMICWANENWSRRWDGLEHEVLMRQEYSAQDDIDHIRFLCKNFFHDSRYIRVDGKPFFVVYRPALFPDIRKTLDTWRSEALKEGIGELYLGYSQSFGMKSDPKEMGFDCGIEFHPDFHGFSRRKPVSLLDKIKLRLKVEPSAHAWNTIVSYKEYIRYAKSLQPQPNVFPGITPMWDNSPRKKKDAYIFHDASPALYEEWLEHIFGHYSKAQDKNKFVFINAWNEWAEGNHLEPCLRWGRQYLEATQRVIGNHKFQP